jgi:hypothetical protein
MKVAGLLATLIASLFVVGAATAATPPPVFVVIHEPHPRGDPQSETYRFHNGLLRVTLRFDESAAPEKVIGVEAVCNGRRQSFAIHGDYYAYWGDVFGKVEIENGRFFQADFIDAVATQMGAKAPDHNILILCDRQATSLTVEEIKGPPTN